MGAQAFHPSVDSSPRTIPPDLPYIVTSKFYQLIMQLLSNPELARSVLAKGVRFTSDEEKRVETKPKTVPHSLTEEPAPHRQSNPPTDVEPIFHEAHAKRLQRDHSSPHSEPKQPIDLSPSPVHPGDKPHVYGVKSHPNRPISLADLHPTQTHTPIHHVQPLVDAITEYVDERLARSLADAIRQGILPR